MGKAVIFVSHSHKDEDFTQRLVEDLHQAGAEVWVDVVGLTHGNFMQRIDEALAQCAWMVLVLTPNAIASQYVKSEVYSALMRVNEGYMRDVIPVLAAPCALGTIPAQWAALHRYDATQDYAAALAGLLRAVGLPVVAPSPPRAAPPRGFEATMIRPERRGARGPETGEAIIDHLWDRPPAIPAERFPSRLAQLGFVGRVINGVEVIIPPVCDVPAGQFLMGGNPAQDSETDANERPQQRLDLPAFQLGRYPVTVAEYACFVRATEQPAPRAQGSTVDWQTQLQRLDHPVVCVSWREARDYTGWLAYVTGEPWRLPTEAEWEKAGRGADGRIYPWGDAFEQWRCNIKASNKNTTTPVGAYPAGASPYGALDMMGNVQEATNSLLRAYPYKPDDGREAVNSTEPRVLRGGSWAHEPKYGRLTARVIVAQDWFGVYAGFRLARPASVEPAPVARWPSL